MNLTDAERRENQEALEAVSLPEKLEYVFEYYKFPLVLALIAVVALGSVLYYRLTRREALLYVACANIAMGEELEAALNQGFIYAMDRSPIGSEVRLYHNLYLSQDATVQNHEYAYASQLKVMAAMSSGQLDVLLMNREAYPETEPALNDRKYGFNLKSQLLKLLVIFPVVSALVAWVCTLF